MPTHATPHERPHSRRGFLTKAAVATGIAWTTPVLSAVFTPASAALASVPLQVTISGLTLVAPPASVANLANDTAASIFSEGCVLLSSPLNVDRGGATAVFGGNETAPTTIPSGTIVCSYYIRSQRLATTPAVQAGSISFGNANIVGLSYTTGNLGGSGGTNNRLGVPGTGYSPVSGSEGGDSFFSVDDLGAGTSALFVNMLTRNGGADTIRVIVTPS